MMSENKLESDIIAVLRTVYDPEIPVSIYELGLIYDINIKQNNNVDILMTLTTPHCPVAEILPKQIEDAVKKIEEVNKVKVEITWEPTWTQEMMSEAARLELGLI
jgi:FeS assembly SUF system protein